MGLYDALFSHLNVCMMPLTLRGTDPGEGTTRAGRNVTRNVMKVLFV